MQNNDEDFHSFSRLKDGIPRTRRNQCEYFNLYTKKRKTHFVDFLEPFQVSRMLENFLNNLLRKSIILLRIGFHKLYSLNDSLLSLLSIFYFKSQWVLCTFFFHQWDSRSSLTFSLASYLFYTSTCNSFLKHMITKWRDRVIFFKQISKDNLVALIITKYTWWFYGSYSQI